MTQSGAVYPSFRAKHNDLECRNLIYRSIRRARSSVQRLCVAAGLMADEPSVIRAWGKGWDALHYVRLVRWRESGFRPNVVYDIGAYDGAWAEMCSEILTPRQIILFEPQTQLHEKIRARQARLRTADWRVLPFALGEGDGSGLMHVTQNAAATSLLRPVHTLAPRESAISVVGTIRVPVRSLDDVVAAEQVDSAELIKIDVQGLENEVLRGGHKSISQAAKLVIEVSLREIYSGQPLFFDVMQTVAGMGFVLEDITETVRRWPSGELWQVDLWLGRRFPA